MWWLRWHTRRFFRSIMNPLDPEMAVRWERNLRYFYVFLGFNVMLLSVNYFRKRRQELQEAGLLVEDITPAHRKARHMNMSNNMTIVRVGLNGRQSEVYEFHPEEYRKEMADKEAVARIEIEKLDQKKKQLKKSLNNTDQQLVS
ncbi:uncharacterized protein LOC128956141 [Oppia nitens]|uniref:uncharacterized protein LOC128956141 n=1 Tax=Oppia nitens TaxID=1686743 RepID=UPI0023DA4468|nr:uncharacterized protein LOC128956141 [Oppia nitens]